MKIAIISDDGLPDARIEKLINTLSKIVNEIHFIGDFRGWSGIELSVEPVIHSVKWDRKVNLLLPPYFQWIFRKVRKILESIKPDIVIACNLVSGYIVDKLGYPMILDYHEVWSLLLKYIEPPTFLRKLTYKRRCSKYPVLEEVLVKKYPTITISDNARRYFMEKYGVSNIYVVKNYPSKLEVARIVFTELDCRIKYFSYIGRDLVFFDGQTYRDMRPVIKALDNIWSKRKDFRVLLLGTRESTREYIDALGRRKHIELYDTLSKSHYGLLTYKPSPVQYLVNPNKPYMYAHSGTLPIITSSIEEIARDLGKYSIIVDADNYSDSLLETLETILNMECEEINGLRKKIYEYSRKKLIWEKQEDTILDLLKKI